MDLRMILGHNSDGKVSIKKKKRKLKITSKAKHTLPISNWKTDILNSVKTKG